MREGSQTTAVDTSTGIKLVCPDWCTKAQDDSHETDDLVIVDLDTDNVFGVACHHPGPTWGPFSAGASINQITGATYPYVDFDVVHLHRRGGLDGCENPVVLRQLAADALAAAEWLEAHR